MKWTILSCFLLFVAVQCEPQVEDQKSWIDLGCWRDIPQYPTMKSLEETDEILDGDYHTRTNPIQKCRQAARKAGYQIFALQNGGQCRAGATSKDSYQKYGKSQACNDNGKGGKNANQVYMIKTKAIISLSSLGCWNTATVHIPILETEHVDPNVPADIIQKCARAAAFHQYEVFAIHNDKCLSSANAKNLYKVYGPSSLCLPLGIGTPKAIQVYEINAIEKLDFVGCWREPKLLRPQPPTAEKISGYFSYRCKNSKTSVVESCIGMGNVPSHKILGLENKPCENITSNIRVQHRAISQDCKKSEPTDKVYEVYKMRSTPIPLTHLGCWNKVERLIPSLEKTHKILQDDFITRQLAIQKCAEVAYIKGYDVIALTEGGKCLSGVTARDYYQKNGFSTQCNKEGKGTASAMDVYQINIMYMPKFNNLGCWRDTSDRAIPTLEGKSAFLDSKYETRFNPFDKCICASTSLGLNVFSLQNGGWCASSKTALQTYRKYGKSFDCRRDGEGGGWANQVYEVKSLTKVTFMDMGCWYDHVIPTLEGLNLGEGVGHYLNETETITNSKIQMCAKAAFSRGYTFFALQNGMCMASENVEKVYQLHGPSKLCSLNGLGGPDSNQVYKINVVSKINYF